MILGAMALGLAAGVEASAAALPAPVPAGVAGGGDLLWLAPTDLARELDLVVGAGASWVRLDFQWSAIESVRGKYDWTAPDRVVAAASARGLHVLGMPAYTP